MTPEHMPTLARLLARVLVDQDNPESVAADVTEFRRGFTDIHFVRK